MAGRRSDTKDTPYFDAWQFPDLLWREAVSYGKFPNKNNTLLTSKRQCVSRARLPSHDSCSMNEPMRDCLFGKRLFTSRQWRKKFPKKYFRTRNRRRKSPPKGKKICFSPHCPLAFDEERSLSAFWEGRGNESLASEDDLYLRASRALASTCKAGRKLRPGDALTLMYLGEM